MLMMRREYDMVVAWARQNISDQLQGDMTQYMGIPVEVFDCEQKRAARNLECQRDGKMAALIPLPPIPEPCDHEWEYVDDSQGDGVWFQSGGYEQSVKCDETREYEPPYFDDGV